MAANDHTTRTLLVIDNNPNGIHSVYDVLYNRPYNIISTNDGEEGLKMLVNEPEVYSAVILGHNIKNINGIRLLHKINSSSNTKTIPVIMEVSSNSDEEMELCIRAGARYCIPKKIDREFFPKIIDTAIRDQERYANAEKGVMKIKPIGHTLITASFKVQSLQEAQVASNLMAGECPNPRLAVVGITEMLINAIEHGNLGISYAEKTKLHEAEQWISEINRRLMLDENKEKYVDIIFSKTSSHITIRIIDCGDGFDWRMYQNLDTNRVFDNHGRGIVMARSLTFESLIYHGKGNDVECIIPTS